MPFRRCAVKEQAWIPPIPARNQVLPLQMVDNSSNLSEWLKRGCQRGAGDRAGHTRADFRRLSLVRRSFSTARRARAALPAEGS
jgi:hypothetical protein